MKERNTIEQEMERVADLRQKKGEEYAEKRNNSTCTVCGGTEFVQKFRNVVGEISGSMHGYFSLFGGRVSGSIDGYTKTLPVLSCRKCGNEREIAVWNYVCAKDVFWEFMYDFYFGVDEGKIKPIYSFFLENPVETREYMLKNPNFKFEFYNEIPSWSPEIWATQGFKIPKIKKRNWLFWEKQIYPTWEELSSN